MKKFGLFLLFFGLFSFISLSLSAQTSNVKADDKATTTKTCCKTGEASGAKCATPCNKGAGEGHKCCGNHGTSNTCNHGTASNAAKCCANKAKEGHNCCKGGEHQGCQHHKDGTVPTDKK